MNVKVIVDKEEISKQLDSIREAVESGTLKGIVVLDVGEEATNAIIEASQGGVETRVVTFDEAIKLIQSAGSAVVPS